MTIPSRYLSCLEDLSRDENLVATYFKVFGEIFTSIHTLYELEPAPIKVILVVTLSQNIGSLCRCMDNLCNVSRLHYPDSGVVSLNLGIRVRKRVSF